MDQDIVGRLDRLEEFRRMISEEVMQLIAVGSAAIAGDEESQEAWWATVARLAEAVAVDEEPERKTLPSVPAEHPEERLVATCGMHNYENGLSYRCVLVQGHHGKHSPQPHAPKQSNDGPLSHVRLDANERAIEAIDEHLYLSKIQGRQASLVIQDEVQVLEDGVITEDGELLPRCAYREEQRGLSRGAWRCRLPKYHAHDHEPVPRA